jgi:hypothetical protein
VLVFLCVAAGAVLALANAGGSEKPRRTAARAVPAGPIEVPLKAKHRSGVTGTARLVQDGDSLRVSVKLSKPVKASLPAHIHTGPCSDEPTFRNPRIWVGLTELVDGASETTVTLATLPELRAEPSSINVHDPHDDLRPMVCGDIPRG